MIDDLTPFIRQHDQEGEEQSWPRPVWHGTRCGFCAKPISYGDYLAIVSDHANSISYPQDTPARCFLSHGRCGPGIGYAVPLSRLLAEGLDGPKGWRTHLREKIWFNYAIHDALEVAYALAVKLNPKAEQQPSLMKAFAFSAPTRPSRVSDNPRSISTRTRTRIMERDGFRCRRCGHGSPDVALVVDHVIPVAKGGTAEEKNLQTLCRQCNAGKSDRNPHEHDMRALR